MTDEEVAAQVSQLGDLLLPRAAELADKFVDRIQSHLPIYRAEAAVSRDELWRTSFENIDYICRHMGRAATVRSVSVESRENGRGRAQAGVPLTAILEAYRLALRVLWEALAEVAASQHVTAAVTLQAASEMFQVLDTFSQEVADGYRDEAASLKLAHEQERSALVQALLEGRLVDVNLWEAADYLRLPERGPYAVVAAQVPDIGRHAFIGIEQTLSAVGITSAWQLLHDVEAGIVRLDEGGMDRLVDTVASAGSGRIGISSPYEDLRNTADAWRLARIALRSTFDGQRITVFDRDPLAVATSSAPDVMKQIAGNILSDLDSMPARDRALLLQTFGVWLDNGGSAPAAARILFCHPNTVRYRLTKLEERTGRSLSNPRDITELGLAYEIDRRL